MQDNLLLLCEEVLFWK